MKGPILIAMAIDNQFKSMLETSLNSILDSISIGFSERFKPECQTCIELIYWISTYMARISTPGMKAFHLQFHGKMKAIIGLVWLVFIGLLKRCQKNTSSEIQNESSNLSKYVKVLNSLNTILSWSNHLLFLTHGVYPQFIHRITDVQMVCNLIFIIIHCYILSVLYRRYQIQMRMN
jgi:hypothetical protein